MHKAFKLLANVALVSGAERILDPHVHSITDWGLLNYTYDAGSIFEHNWTHSDYAKATRPSALPPTEFLFMSLVGLPKAQHLDQVRLAHREAQRIEAAKETPRMVGLVTDADLADAPDDFAAFLDAAATASPLLVGARPVPVPWDASGLLENLGQLQRRGLVWDVLMSDNRDLPKLYDVARQVPKLRIVLNHFGFCCFPVSPLPEFEAWAATMSKLATLPNVHVKISGGQAPNAPGKALEVMRPYVEHTIREFGYERSIYNGNWFVVDAQEGFYSYRSWAAAVVDYLQGLNATDEERAELLYGAGARVYGLSRPLEI